MDDRLVMTGLVVWLQSCRTLGRVLSRSAGDTRRIEPTRHRIESKPRFQRPPSELIPADARSGSTTERGPAKRRQSSSVPVVRFAEALCGHHDQRCLTPQNWKQKQKEPDTGKIGRCKMSEQLPTRRHQGWGPLRTRAARRPPGRVESG